MLREYYSEDCLFMPSGKQLKGKKAIRNYLESSFAKGWGQLTIDVTSVLPVFDVYITFHLVHVTFPSFTIMDKKGKVIVTGNVLVGLIGESWEITESLWSVLPLPSSIC